MDSEKSTDTPVSTPVRRKRFLKFPRTWREVRAMGWKMIVAFILFYLIRDTILYILLPYLVIKGIISF